MIKWHGYILSMSCLEDGTNCPGTAAFLGLFGFLWLQRSRQAAPFHPMPAAALQRGHTEQWILSSRVSPGPVLLLALPFPPASRGHGPRRDAWARCSLRAVRLGKQPLLCCCVPPRSPVPLALPLTRVFCSLGATGGAGRCRGAIPTGLLLPAARRWPSPPWGPAVALNTSPRAGLAHEALQ